MEILMKTNSLTKHPTPPIRKPAHSLRMQSRETVLPPRLVEMHPLIEPHVHEHRVPLSNVLARRSQRVLHLAHRNGSPEFDVREVQRDGGRVKVFQGHFVDGGAAGAKVLEGVDVRAGVVGHC
jgi:hypothetical protein